MSLLPLQSLVVYFHFLCLYECLNFVFLSIGHSVDFSQPIEVIEKLHGLLIEYIHLPTSDFTFANELFRYVKFSDIIFEVKLLSREVTLNNTFETTTESHEPGKVYVAEVTVTCEKKQLIVKPKVSSFCLSKTVSKQSSQRIKMLKYAMF